MNISYNWLKDLIRIDLPAEELGRKLTSVGLAVDGVHAHGGDFVLDIDLTSNRPDCLSHLGVAREIGVIIKKELTAEIKRRGDTGVEVPYPAVLAPDVVRILDSDLCHRFTARIIKDVTIGPSPQWLVDRLEAIGERSINNVADITNYVMHELGQPMHSFDLDKLSENRILVRRAENGETITTLDQVERKLDSTMLAICDAEKPVAIGGIMGGADSGITEKTGNVLLEVAYFKRENIRATSRKLGLITEASYRFERGVDIQNLIRASARATDLICEFAGGKPGDFVDVYPTKFQPKEIESKDISIAVTRLTGLEVSTDACDVILTSLGIVESEQSKVQNPGSKFFLSPSWRYDIAIEEDLVEEVARHAGYENIATELPPSFGAGEYQATEVREKLLRQTLVDMGFDEALSYSFIDTKFDDVFETVPGLIDEKSEEKYVTMQDSVIEGAIRMRPSILPGLLDAVRHNLNHQRRDLKLFEIGKVFAASEGEEGLPLEQELLALVITGGETEQNKAIATRTLDFYDAKGAIESALVTVSNKRFEFCSGDIKHLRRGQTAVVSVGGKAVGSIGRLSDEVAAGYKFKQPVYAAEIDLSAILALPVDAPAYAPLAKYPAIVRDVSLVAKRDLTFASIVEAITGQNFDLCRSVEFVDVYEGKGLSDDERSVTIRLEYRSDERTLIEDEVEAMHKQIISKVEQDLGVQQKM